MNKHRSAIAWTVLGASFVLALLYAFTIYLIDRHGTKNRDPGWTYEFRNGIAYISQIAPGSPADGKLRAGDRIVAINGQTNFTGYNPETSRFLRIPAGDQYQLEVIRQSQTVQYRLAFVQRSAASNLISVLLPLLSSIVSAIVAFVIGYAKPDEKIPRLFSITWFSVAFVQLAFALHHMQTILSPAEYRLTYLTWAFSLQPISVVVAYHGYYLFPSGIEDSRFWSGIKHFLYLFGAVFITLFTIIRLFLVLLPERTVEWHFNNERTLSLLAYANAGLMAVGIISICAVTARNFRKVLLPNQKRRLQWVVFGSIIGVMPVGLYFIGRLISYDRYVLATLNYISLNFLTVIPIAVAFAIVKHRLFDIRVVVRRGLQYLLARKFLNFLVYLPGALLLYVIFSNPNQSVSKLFLDNSWFLIFMVLAILLLKKQKPLLHWLDRKFFRSDYNAEQILLSMIDEVKNLNSISEVSRWVTLQLQGALHPESVLLFYRKKEKGDLALGYSSGQRLIGFQIPEDSRLVQLGENEFKSRDVNYFLKQGLPEREKQWLNEERIHLIVPMHSPDDRLIGLLMLGEKKSEQPYTGNDRKLLEGLSSQIAILHENLSLREKVQKEVRLKEEVLAQFQEQKKNLLKECPLCGACYDSIEEVCGIDGARLDLSIPVERTIDGKYRLEKLLGRGGMGAVYKATDLRLSRTVAVKVIIGSMFGDAMALRRFEREARTSARLSHPNIITVFDFGTIGQGAYLVMEYVEGQTLREYLKKNGNVPPDLAADWFNQILEGINAAHRTGVVHRDLKPENILLAQTGPNKITVKILDFGLAKVKMTDSVDSRSLTSPGAVLGTLNYMSPEQIVGIETDHRTDIFALGVMIVEALTGQLPFSANIPSAVAMNILQKEISFEREGKEVRELNSQIQKCVAKDKKKRFDSVEQMQQKIIPAIRHCPAFPSAQKSDSVWFSGRETDVQ